MFSYFLSARSPPIHALAHRHRPGGAYGSALHRSGGLAGLLSLVLGAGPVPCSGAVLVAGLGLLLLL